MKSIAEIITQRKRIIIDRELLSGANSHDCIDVILEDIRHLFWGAVPRPIEDEENNLSMQIKKIKENLYQCLRKFHNDAQSILIAQRFIEKLPDVCVLSNSDVEAAFKGDPAAAGFEEIILCYPGVYAVMVQRIANILYGLKATIIPRKMTELAHSKTGIDIHPGSKIGKAFFIDHGTGVVIGETTIIGNNVKIYQGVTLGALSTSGGQKLKNRKRHPTVEDHVTIYAGASIFGGDTVIGRNSVVGGNVFITESVPPNSKVRLEFQNRNIYIIDQYTEK